MSPNDDSPKQDQLKDSQYDGIQEYDNDLPRWWLGTFFITIIFGFGYWAHYYVLGSGPGQDQEYQNSVAFYERIYSSGGEETGEVETTNETLLALLEKSDVLGEGKKIYMKNCTPCHGQLGEGTIGPNLTDTYWIHGGKPMDIYNIIVNGVPEKGMVPWNTVLKNSEIQAATAYVLSLKGTNPANGKAPQGEKE